MYSFPFDPRRGLAGRLFGIHLFVLAALGCGTREGAPDGGGGPDSPAAQLVGRSIAFHDPGGAWGSRAIEMVWFGTGTDGGERVSVDLEFGSDESDFSLSGRYAGSSIEYEVSGSGLGRDPLRHREVMRPSLEVQSARPSRISSSVPRAAESPARRVRTDSAVSPLATSG